MGPRDAPPDPTGLALDSSRERLYIADNDNHRIVLFNLPDRSFGASQSHPYDLVEVTDRFPTADR